VNLPCPDRLGSGAQEYFFVAFHAPIGETLLLFCPAVLGLGVTVREEAMEDTEIPVSSLQFSGYEQAILLDNIPYPIWLKDETGRYVYVNEPFLTFYGLPRQSILAKDDQSLFPPDLASDYRSKEQLLASQGEKLQSTELAQVADGRRIRVQATRTPVFDDTGKFVGVTGIMREMTSFIHENWPLFGEVSSAENQGEAQYRPSSKQVVVGILRTTADGKILNVNPATVRILGYDSVDEMISGAGDMESRLYVHPEDPRKLTAMLGQRNTVEGFETQVYRKDGAIARVLLNLDPVFGDQGRTIYFEGTIQDITETWKAEEALRHAEEKYRNIFENAIEGIFQKATDGRIISANPALARILGYDSPEDLMNTISNMDKQAFVSERRLKEYQELMKVRGVVRDFEAQVYCKDKSVHWVSVNCRSVIDDRGSVRYYEGTIESITDRKRLEAQLRNAQKMESIGTLAGGVAHDFNNILTTIMGYCSLVMMKAGKGDPLLGYIDQIMEAANRASTLTHSLLSFSRKQVAETKAIDVNETIKGVEKLLRRIIGEDIELRTVLCLEKSVVIVGDGQIGQILMNIATNARDAMPDGGTLTIKTEQVHLSGDLMETNDGMKGLFAAIEVSDTGSGMDEWTKDQAFDPFFTTKEVGKGTGLGLSIVYGIVKQNKGYVNVTSEPGKGTSITVYFPLAEAAPGTDSLHEKAELQGGSETILVAEDNNQVREIVTTTLTDFGYHVVEAFDGADAVEKFGGYPGSIDLLLLDVIMPRKNGKEAYLEIKKLRPETKAIFMSGYTGDILSRKGINRVGIPMISKPIVIERLLKEIRDVLDKAPSQLTLFP
jgi:PAS domain S-box-containing protein